MGANINTPLFYNKRTPLMISVYNGYLEIASLLLEKGANKDSKDINGMGVLHYAVDSNRVEAVKFCLEFIEDVDQRDNNGWTPLLRAGTCLKSCLSWAQLGNLFEYISAIVNATTDISNLLIDKGADPEAKDKLGFNFYKHLSL